MKLAVAISVVFLASTAFAFVPENPGLKLRITQKLLDGIWNVTVKVVNYTLTHPKAFRGSSDKVKLVNFTVGTHELRFAEPDQVVWSHTGGKLVLDMQQSLQDEHGDTKQGIATMTLSNITNKLLFTLEKTDKNQIKPSLKECQFDLGSANMTLEKWPDATDYMRTVASTTGGLMKAMFGGMVCPTVMQAFDTPQLRAALDYEPVLTMGDSGLQIDLSLTGPPKATKDYLDISFSGYISAKDAQDRMAVMFDPHPLVDKVDNNRMFYGFLSDEVLNQAIRAWMSGRAGYTKSIGKDKGKIYEDLRALAIKVAEKAGKTITIEDGAEFEISLIEPPTVTFGPDADKPEHHVQLSAKLKISFVATADGEQPSEVAAQFDVDKILNVKMEVPEDKRYPRLAMKSHIAKVKINSIEGAESLTEEQLTSAAEELKTAIEGHMQKAIEKGVEKFNEKMEEAEREGESSIDDEDADKSPKSAPVDEEKDDDEDDVDVPEKAKSAPFRRRRDTETEDENEVTDEEKKAEEEADRPGRRRHHHKTSKSGGGSGSWKHRKHGMRTSPRSVSFPNTSLQFFKHTAVLSFDIGLDLNQIFKDIEKQKMWKSYMRGSRHHGKKPDEPLLKLTFF